MVGHLAEMMVASSEMRKAAHLVAWLVLNLVVSLAYLKVAPMVVLKGDWKAAL